MDSNLLTMKMLDVYVLLFPFILAGTEVLFFAVIACIFGAKWWRSSISREPKMPRITDNHLHCHSWVLPQNFIRSTSHPIQLLLQHWVLHIRHSPRSCQESIQHWDPAHTHHIPSLYMVVKLEEKIYSSYSSDFLAVCRWLATWAEETLTMLIIHNMRDIIANDKNAQEDDDWKRVRA